MFGLKRMVIAQHERGLYLHDGSIEKILEPGVYWIFDWFRNIQVERYNITEVEFTHRYEDILIKEKVDLCKQYFQLVELGDHEVGYVYRNGKFSYVLPPATRQLFWRGPVDIEVQVQNIETDYEVAKDKVSLLANSVSIKKRLELTKTVLPIEVPEQTMGLLFVDGVLTKTLSSGLYAFWKYNRKVKVELVDTRLQAMDVSGQEILTKDKVSLRINLAATYKIVDPVKARSQLVNVTEFIYRELQFAIREAIGTHVLDALLADKGELDDTIYKAVKNKLSIHGVVIEGVGVKDIILPGDMKNIMSQVVETEKAAQANIIKRREETAATRSLLNTAKLMEQNPVLLRLKELEALEKMTDKIDKFTVFGGLESVLQEVVKIGVKSA